MKNMIVDHDKTWVFSVARCQIFGLSEIENIHDWQHGGGEKLPGPKIRTEQVHGQTQTYHNRCVVYEMLKWSILYLFLVILGTEAGYFTLTSAVFEPEGVGTGQTVEVITPFCAHLNWAWNWPPAH